MSPIHQTIQQIKERAERVGEVIKDRDTIFWILDHDVPALCSALEIAVGTIKTYVDTTVAQQALAQIEAVLKA